MNYRLSLMLAPVLLILPSICIQEEPSGIEQLKWMSGHWSRVAGGIEMEEAWLGPKGGMMLGVHRDVSIEKDRTVSFEYLRIEQRKEDLVYIASPSGGTATEFTMIESEKNSVTFENPEHDFPKRIIYSRSEDKLIARIEGDGEKSMEWEWDLRP